MKRTEAIARKIRRMAVKAGRAFRRMRRSGKTGAARREVEILEEDFLGTDLPEAGAFEDEEVLGTGIFDDETDAGSPETIVWEDPSCDIPLMRRHLHLKAGCEKFRADGNGQIPEDARASLGNMTFRLAAGSRTARLAAEDAGELYVYFRCPASQQKDPDDPRELVVIAALIADEAHERLFKDIEDVEERLDCLKTFSRMTSVQQEFLMSRAAAPAVSTAAESRNDFKPFLEKDELKVVYELCKHTLPPDERRKADHLMEKIGYANLTDLSYCLGIDTRRRVRRELTYEEIIAILDRHVYGRRELKEEIAECVLEAQYAGGGFFSMLLVGSPGVGKTSFADALSDVFECDQIYIDCGTAMPIDLFGLVRSYHNSQPSKVAAEIRARGTTSLVLLFDEIDKMISEKDGCGFSALLKPLGPKHVYHDDYLNDDIDVSNSKFLCTANDINSIPDYIIDRFEGRVVFMDDYTPEEKAEIGRQFVVPREMSRRRIAPEELTFTDGALRLIAEEYCTDKGVRHMTGNVQKLMRKAIVEWLRGSAGKPLVVDEDYVRRHLTVSRPVRRIGY